jgi:hypothetical protein
MSAVERYFAERGEAETENYTRNEDKIRENLDQFILGATVLNEQSGAEKYTVAVRVEINEAKLRNVIRGSSAVKNAAGSAKSNIVYLFTGRKIDSVKSFDDRIVKKAEMSASSSLQAEGAKSESVSGSSASTSASSVKGDERESISGSRIGTSASQVKSGESELVANSNVRTSASMQDSEQVSLKVETGGSQTRKADQTTYSLLPLGNQKSAITSVFSQAGFQVNDPEFVLSPEEIAAVNSDFSQGGDLAPSTIRGVVHTLKEANIPYLVLATLDVNEPSVDPASGMYRVAVKVTARVLDLASGLPREVASVPPIHYSGLGVKDEEAQDKALNEGSLRAAKEVVQRLNAVDVQ